MLYVGGSEVRFVNFKANGEDNINWFSQGNLVSSSWNDLTTIKLPRKFAIQGDHVGKRSFEITESYSGCPNDVGWLVITKSSSEGCDWGKRNPGTNIVYSKTANSENYSSGK